MGSEEPPERQDAGDDLGGWSEGEDQDPNRLSDMNPRRAP